MEVLLRNNAELNPQDYLDLSYIYTIAAKRKRARPESLINHGENLSKKRICAINQDLLLE